MDAINNKSVNDAALRIAQNKLNNLQPEFDLRFVYSLDVFLFNSKSDFRKTN